MTECPSCGSADLEVFFELDGIPTHSCLLMASAEEARAFPRGSLRLALCRACGFITNTAFDAAHNAYSATYEETQGFSPRFRTFMRDLAHRWVDRYDIHGKDILEIGCGKGEFLVEMCDAGDNRGTGIDPSYLPERTTGEAAQRVQFIRELYSEQYRHLAADVVVCRHTLEHIAPVRDFMRLVRSGIGTRDHVMVLFELPDVLRVMQEVAFWDVYYEHCSYFSMGSLARLFRATGFEVLDLSLDYDDQYILIEARPTKVRAPAAEPLAGEDDIDEMVRAVEHFSKRFPDKLDEWRNDLAKITQGGRRAVIWGAGSKGVAYLTTLGVEDQIEYAVDINPFKQGMYLAGTGQKVVGPEFLKEYRPDAVIAMNPIYCEEIRRELDALGVGAELFAV